MNPPLTRPDVIRVLTAQGLMREGLLPPLADQIEELWLAYKKRQEDLGKSVPAAKALTIEVAEHAREMEEASKPAPNLLKSKRKLDL